MIDEFEQSVRAIQWRLSYNKGVFEGDNYLDVCAAKVLMRLGNKPSEKYDIRNFKPLSGESST